MANLRVTIPIGRIGKFERNESAMARVKPLWTVSKHLVCKCRSDECGQKFVENYPLIVPPQLPSRFVEYATVRNTGKPSFIDKRIVSLQHGEMQLRHQHVRIVARIAY